jgi:hypothetical protein
MGRRVFSYESVEEWYKRSLKFAKKFHKVSFVKEWDDVDLEKIWGVAFIDHTAERRAADLQRLANYAQFIVVHDTQPENSDQYGAEEVLKSFKYRFDYKKDKPWTSVVSNFTDPLTFL